jgi:flagellar protein FliO/FliZ
MSVRSRTARVLAVTLCCVLGASALAAGQAAPAATPAAAAPTAPVDTPARPLASPTTTAQAPAPVTAAPAPVAAPRVAAPGRPPLPPPAAPGYAPGPSAGSLFQTLASLMLVLGLLAALAWALKRWGPRGQVNAGGLRIVSALNLGGRERIIVVEVGDQWIVVGASPGRVNALATMPRQESAAAPATLAPHGAPASSFSDWLKQTIEKRNAPNAP